MKMRKLFAGIAAAATLLGGMALGATSAQADDAAGTPVTGEATFTFTAETEAQLTHANLTAYKIGDYVQYGDSYGVVTNSDNKKAVDPALKAAGVDTADPKVDHLAAALNAGTLDISATRPWDKTANGNASTTRAFANALEKEKLAKGTTVKFAATSGSAEDGYSATVTLPAGIYVFIDSAAATESVTKAIPMIVASGTVADKVLTDPIRGANTVNMKNTNNPEKTKEVNKTSAAIGDTLIYTLTGVVANPAPTAFKFTDTPSKGLTIKASSFQFFTEDANAKRQAEPANNFSVTPTGDFTGNGTASFDVEVKNPSAYAGKKIVVTFEAVINDEADVENGVVNKLDNYGTSVQVPTTFGKFEFTKVDPDGKGIENVTFQVKDDDTTLYFVKQGGFYKKAASADTQGATTNVKTGADGKLSFTGLDKTKTYTVMETARANGNYLDIKPSFTVSFNNNGEAVLSRTTASDPWGLVNTTAKTVKNVKSITQLPLTGAAGTTLFTVVALLVAGAGVTVAVKSRQRMH